MEYKKLNLSDITANQLSKFRTKIWVEINDDTREAYTTNIQIKSKIQC